MRQSMRQSLDPIGDRVRAPAGDTVELWRFNRRQKTCTSMRHSLVPKGDRIHAPTGVTAYMDQIGDKVHSLAGETVEL